jgi:DNA helicase-2/ATP-dependent DNA helicase PcrA
LIGFNPVPRLGDSAALQAVLTVRPEQDAVQMIECASIGEEAKFAAAEMMRLHKEKGIAFSEMALLFRSNPRQAVSRQLEPHFIQARVPYTIVAGQALYEAKVVKQILSYLRLLLNPLDEMAFDVVAKHQKLPKSFGSLWRTYRGSKESSSEALQRFVADRSLSGVSVHREPLLTLARLFGSWKLSRVTLLSVFVRSTVIEEAGGFDWRDDNTAERMSFLIGQMETEGDKVETTLEEQLVAFLEQIALFSPSERDDAKHGTNRCSLTTIHQSKGLEWSAVFVIYIFMFFVVSFC